MKKKKINRSLLFLILLGVAVTIIAMSVVYAALSTKLLIDGSAEIPNSSFGIKVEPASVEEVLGMDYQSFCSTYYTCYDNVLTAGNGSLDSTPVVTNTFVSNLNASVQIPGDGVELIYKITNTGSIPVKLHNIISDGFEYSSANNSDADIEWLVENLVFDTFFERTNGGDFYVNDVLCPGESVYYIMVLMIPEEVTTIPSGKVEMYNSGVTYEFLQTDQYLCD